MKNFLDYWYGKYRDLKLAEKMIIVYILMLGSCFLISAWALQVSFNIYDGKLYEKSLQELDFFIQEVNRSLDEVEGISYNIAMDLKIQEQLSKMKDMDSSTADYSYEVYQLRLLLIMNWLIQICFRISCIQMGKAPSSWWGLLRER